MTTIPPSESSSSPTEPGSTPTEPSAPPEPPPKNIPLAVAKGCGCLVVLIVLAVGVALVGGGEPSSWGSALFGVVILIVLVGSSGLIGWWNK
jgi:uncharacterized protein HemX